VTNDTNQNNRLTTRPNIMHGLIEQIVNRAAYLKYNSKQLLLFLHKMKAY